jgi:SAM-dependent methyltransferase
MYLPRARAGDEAGFWEEVWSRQAVAAAVASCALHPLRDPLRRLLPTSGWILDAGCGIGASTIYYARQGRRLLGLDFARPALAALRAVAPHLPVCAGRVDALPFVDAAVGACYSGGVIEHFEAGPGPALAEAYRVLQPGGLLLVVVPDLSPLRLRLCPNAERLLVDGDKPVVGFRRVAGCVVDASPWPDLQFFQYLYAPGDLRPRLRAAGFELLGDRGYGIQWALMERPAVQRLSARLRAPILHEPADYYDRVPMTPAAQEPLIPVGLPPAAHHLLRRFLTWEDDRLPVLGAALRPLQALAANIRLYVCRRPLATAVR